MSCADGSVRIAWKRWPSWSVKLSWAPGWGARGGRHPRAAGQRPDVLLGQAGVGARRARLRALERGVDRAGEQTLVDADVGGVLSSIVAAWLMRAPRVRSPTPTRATTAGAPGRQTPDAGRWSGVATITFDLNGTLFDRGDEADALQQAAALAMAHTLVGDVRPFADLLEAAGGEVPDHMPPFPDVGAGLDHLAAAGHALAVITNSARDTGEEHLRRAGLRERFGGSPASTRRTSTSHTRGRRPSSRATGTWRRTGGTSSGPERWAAGRSTSPGRAHCRRPSPRTSPSSASTSS